MVAGLLDSRIAGTLVVVAGRNAGLEAALADLRDGPHMRIHVLGHIDELDDLVAVQPDLDGQMSCRPVTVRHIPYQRILVPLVQVLQRIPASPVMRFPRTIVGCSLQRDALGVDSG